MSKIEIYSKSWCPYCNKAKALLKSKGLSYEEIDTTHDEALQQEMVERSRRQTVPQIFIDDGSIGGCDDLPRRLVWRSDPAGQGQCLGGRGAAGL